MMVNNTNGSTDLSARADTNKSVHVQEGMIVVGWVTVGYYGNDIGPTIYGLFETMEMADDWRRKLTSGYTHIVFAPSYNRG